MVKKHSKPQVRKRTKPTVGRLKFQDVVYMQREKIDGKVQVFATCTCDKWRSSDKATTITKVALEAKAHCEETGCRFRKHDPEDKGLVDTEIHENIEKMREALGIREENSD